jgi:hypothetical protein
MVTWRYADARPFGPYLGRAHEAVRLGVRRSTDSILCIPWRTQRPAGSRPRPASARTSAGVANGTGDDRRWVIWAPDRTQSPERWRWRSATRRGLAGSTATGATRLRRWANVRICRIEDVASSHTYAPSCVGLAIVMKASRPSRRQSQAADRCSSGVNWPLDRPQEERLFCTPDIVGLECPRRESLLSGML